MATSPKVQWRQVQQVLGEQRIEQVVVGDKVVNIGHNEGSVIIQAQAGTQAADRVHPRPPPRALPRQVAGFLNRDPEARLASQALARGQVVDLHGLDGVGKTALISQVMHTQLPGHFPDGMVYLSARHQEREDLLQDLFEAFFDTDGSVKARENEVGRYMAGKRALVVVDDANHLEEGDAEALTQALSDCSVLIAGREQQIWQGAAVWLRGLPRQEAVALFERHWGPLAAQDRPTVEAICTALEDVPLAVVKTASTASKRHRSLAQVLQEVQPRTETPEPIGQSFWAIASMLSEGEKQLLGGLATPGGETVGVEALPVITGLPPEKIDQYLGRLQKMGLVHANSPRFSLDEGFRPYIRHYWASEEMRERGADYYLRQARQLRAQSRDPDEENVINALRYYFRRKEWQQVITIARHMEGYLAVAGRWGQWRKRLQNAWAAAREMGDRATEAWAQNQLGVIATGLGDTAAAVTLFKAALGIWQALGNRAGMTITRWNLQILLGPPPPPPPRGKPPGEPEGGLSTLTKVMAGAAGGLIVVVSILIYILVHDNGTPTPTPTTPYVSPTTPRAVETTVTPSRTPRTPTVTPSVTSYIPPPCQCGDGDCDRGAPCYEDGLNCVSDCCQCGDGYCERDYPCSENGYDCPSDCCRCGDGVCERDSPCYEGESACLADCGGEPPPTPIPLEPIEEDEIPCSADPATIDFRWSSVDDESGIAGYTIWVEPVVYETPPGPVPDPIEVDNLSGLSYQLPLECGWNYRWRVRATDGAGYTGAWSYWEYFSVEPSLPDLVVTNLETLYAEVVGPLKPVYDPESPKIVSVDVTIRNQGGTTAGTFKVAVYYTGPSTVGEAYGTYWLSLDLDGEGGAYTSAPLPAGSEVELHGTVTLPAALSGQNITLQAEADSCYADEFQPDYCRVLESNEDNNMSSPVPFEVP